MQGKRWAVVLKLLFILLGITGGFMLFSFATALLYGESFKTCAVFLILGSIGVLCGFSTLFMRKVWRRGNRFRIRDGFITVVLAWMTMILYSSLPYYFGGILPSFTDAFFESMSGYTTTGSTMFNDVESLGKSFLLWRALTQWIGGIGIIVFILALLPAIGLAGNTLFAAEFTAPLEDKISPRLKDTAKILSMVYIGITAVEIILLKLAGMPFFDSICHSFSTVATGGLSTYNDSIAGCSPAVQYIVTIFMFLSGINYLLYYFIIRQQFFKVSRDEELRAYCVYVLIACVVTTVTLYFSETGLGIEESFRMASFNVVSVVTSTGFVTADFNNWIPGLRILMLLLMFSGACAGSSTGGMKISRIVLMIKSTMLEFKRISHPMAVLPLKYNGRVVGGDMMRRILAFFFLYMSIFAFGTLCFAFMGYNPETSFAITASSMGNIGPFMGEICGMCSASSMPIVGKWLSAILMLVGRLGIFTIMILWMPSFWKK